MSKLFRLYDCSTKEYILPPAYEFIHGWGDDILIANSNKDFALYKNTGETLLSLDAEATELPDYASLVNGVGKIVCEGLAGLINAQGEIVLECRYEDVGNWSEGVAPAKKDGKWGFVAVNGDWKILPKYEGADSFLNGYAAVKLDGKTALINRSGETVAPFKYDGAGYVQNGRFPVAEIRNGKEFWGIADIDGTIILPIEYDTVEWIDLELGRTRFHGKPALGLQ